MSDDIVNLPVDPSNGSASSPDESGAAGNSAGEEARSPTFAALMEEARALKPGDDTAVIGLLVKGAALHLNEMQADFLLKAIRKATGMGLKLLRKTWKFWQDEIAKREEAEGREARERTAADWAAKAAEARRQYRDRLYESCRHIAESRTLLADMEEVVHALGAVGESASIRQLYLVCVSRLLDDEAARLLRVGAPSSGKNLVVEKVLKLIPNGEVVPFSGSSPKALAYYGGLDDGALKGKIVYIPEAAIMIGRDGVESDFTIMLRNLISEGRIVYQTVVLQKKGPPETITIRKNGPIAAIITTARDVDPELRTRALINDSDESGKQTAAIFKRVLSDIETPPPDLGPWLNFQEWLMSDPTGAPDVKPTYRVRIPFKGALHTAFERWRPQFLEGAALRARRDIPNILSVIKASAVLHQVQRDKDPDRTIVASIDDYRHVYEAFGADLANIHGHVSEKTIAVVKAVEEIGGADSDLSVKVTLRDLAKRLRIVSPKTADARLQEAVGDGLVEQDDTRTGPSRARYFRVVIPSKDLVAGPGPGLLPPVEIVKNIFERAPIRNTGDMEDTGNTGSERTRI
jgi:hypothetical protein